MDATAREKAPKWLQVEKDAYWETFNEYDLNKDGMLDREELRAALNDMLKNIGRQGLLRTVEGQKVTQEELNRVMAIADLDKNDLIDFDEFCLLMARQTEDWSDADDHITDTEMLLRDAFSEIDIDHNGNLSSLEIKNVLARCADANISDVIIHEIILDLDKDGDGQINLEDFINAFKA